MRLKRENHGLNEAIQISYTDFIHLNIFSLIVQQVELLMTLR